MAQMRRTQPESITLAFRDKSGPDLLGPVLAGFDPQHAFNRCYLSTTRTVENRDCGLG